MTNSIAAAALDQSVVTLAAALTALGIEGDPDAAVLGPAYDLVVLVAGRHELPDDDER